MADPFDVLRAPVVPQRPDPTYARRLHERLARALSLPEGVTVSDLTLDAGSLTRAADEPVATPSPVPAAVPYLAVRDARSAIDWYTEAFGARVSGEPIVMPDGRIGHSELLVGRGVLYLADEHPEIGVVAPTPGAAAVSLVLDVDDTDEVLARVERTGGRRDREPYEGHGHRNAWVVDPFAHRWLLQGPVPGGPRTRAESIRRGDVGYVSWWCPDVDRAARFYSAVLGWQVVGDGVDRYVGGLSLPMGLHGGHETSTLLCCYATDDLSEAHEAVRSAGGEVLDTDTRGRPALCSDGQGTTLALYEPAADEPRPPVTGPRVGDLAYVTHEVPDSARARTFYRAVLGWRFQRGRVEDGWGPVGTAPMIGLAGGRDATVVPMWTVDDTAAAVARVRELGGTATDPEPQPYGLLSATCTDDQGGRFYLGGH